MFKILSTLYKTAISSIPETEAYKEALIDWEGGLNHLSARLSSDPEGTERLEQLTEAHTTLTEELEAEAFTTGAVFGCLLLLEVWAGTEKLAER